MTTSVAAAAALGLSWVAFRRLWWSRVHYHSLLGPRPGVAEIVASLTGLVAELDRVLRAHGIPYWIDAGTLLGAWREGRRIPWDDDVDVCLVSRDHDRLWAARGAFREPFHLLRVSRLWPIDKLVPGLARAWPSKTYLRLLDRRTLKYVDVFEAHDEGSDLVQLPLSLFHRTSDPSGRPFRVPWSWVFPLRPIHFEGLAVTAPREVEAYLHRLFGPDLAPDHELDAERMVWRPGPRARPRGWRRLTAALMISEPPRPVPALGAPEPAPKRQPAPEADRRASGTSRHAS